MAANDKLSDIVVPVSGRGEGLNEKLLIRYDR